MSIRWPCDVLVARDVSFDLAPRSLAGPASVSGATQVVASDAGIWKATYGSIVVNKRNAVLAHRAIAALLEGRLGSIVVPLCRAWQPVPEGAVAAGLYEPVPHSDGAFFSDGSGYAIGAVIDVIAAADADIRATTLTAVVNYAGDIQPGQHFSVGERLYRIRSYDPVTGTMTIRPPLRDAVATGDRLDFDDPVCRMRLLNDDGMDLELSLRKFGTPTVQFIEDV
ncbi:hypothetical protein [Mesorhizobium sp. B1-1-7]|uniref:hypothetical protein n=1 Tax=Mesorhizobium sp. B1-1-7 TaxID=2589977 RepID=UPI00112D4053|nr:hypothetical protein [Mesorhizobium sp. B1-1-7]TPN43204.1 hypothetical protein FJ978_31365 [Mesorhizobium sp. B1-1-7]